MGVSIENLLEQRLTDLRGKPIAELLSLSECAEDVVEVDGKNVKFSTFHEIVDGKHRVVVQAIRERWGGMMAKVVALGFEIGPDQQLRTLITDELYDFT